MAESNKLLDLVKKQPAIGIVFFILVGIIFVKGCERPQKVSYYETEGVISNTKSAKPAKEIIKTEKMLDNNSGGIVSFEMYVPKTEKETKRSLSREEVIQEIIDYVSKISDDVKAKNAVINKVSSLNFKVNSGELLAILQSAKIEDDFYYTNAVKTLAPILSYPVSEQQIKQIVSPVKDGYYRHKLHDELAKEQLRNR